MNQPTPAKIKSVVISLAAKSAELERALHGTATDAVTGWINSQYLSTAQASLTTAADESERFEISRRLARDWAVLRRSDQRAERLRIDRIRLRLTKRNLDNKWAEKVDAGIDAYRDFLRKDPEKGWPVLDAMRAYFIDRKNTRRKAQFMEWLERPEIRKEVLPQLLSTISQETRDKVRKELETAPEPVPRGAMWPPKTAADHLAQQIPNDPRI